MSSWPLNPGDVTSLGQPPMTDRRADKTTGQPRPHRGLDMYAPEGSPVFSPVNGRVIRVVDGRVSDDESRKRAGLWIDIQGEGRVHRLLHLGKSYVLNGAKVKAGERVGDTAPSGTSGLGDSQPHLHYEIRASDWAGKDYGPAEDPRPWLSDSLLGAARGLLPSNLTLWYAQHDSLLENTIGARWEPVRKQIARAQAAGDPETRIREARAAYDGARDAAGMRSLADEASYYRSHPLEGLSDTADLAYKEVIKPAAKAVGSAAGTVAGDLWDASPWWVKAIAGAVIVGVAKEVLSGD